MFFTYYLLRFCFNRTFKLSLLFIYFLSFKLYSINFFFFNSGFSLDVASNFDEWKNWFSQLDHETGSNASVKPATRPFIYSIFRNCRVSINSKDWYSETTAKNLFGRFSRCSSFCSVSYFTKQDYCKFCFFML